MASNQTWTAERTDEEVATALELIAHQSPANVNYYVLLDAARRLRAHAAE